MGDYAMGGLEEENAELRKLNAELQENPDDFETWTKLVQAAESQEGGLNRNSSPAAITSARDVYDRLLAKYPLFFGYWKKYADLEFAIAGTEAAELIYERGVASVTSSVDLWANYCSFKVETNHDNDAIRELFERAANSVGLDFLAHPFWDKYIEFEDRLDHIDNVFTILGRIIHIPLHQYARYFERYRALASSRPVTDLVPPTVLSRLQNEVNATMRGRSGPELERELRLRVDQHHLETFHRTQDETTKRWTYEQEIKRPYFHVTELEEPQLENWHKYLDFEEGEENNYQRTAFLYERCLTACAQYQEFWLRFARWMYSQKGKEEEVRNIYARASCIYVAIAEPAVRHQYALFEESCDRPTIASAILEGILVTLPGDLETIVALANLAYRQEGYNASTAVYQKYIDSQECSAATKGALTTELAHLTWRERNSESGVEEARRVFETQQSWRMESRTYWAGYLVFELRLPTNSQNQTEQLQRIKKIHDDIRSKSRLAPDVIKSLSQQYLVHLAERGGKAAAKEYMDLDAEINGTAACAAAMRVKNVVNGSTKG